MIKSGLKAKFQAKKVDAKAPESGSVYKLPSGGTVRLRPRIEEEAEEDQEVEVRPTKSQRRDPEEEDLPDLGTMEAVEEAESKTLHLTSGGPVLPWDHRCPRTLGSNCLYQSGRSQKSVDGSGERLLDGRAL